VATGNFSRADLLAHQPTALFDDLSDLQAFFDVIEGKTGPATVA